MGLLLRNSWTRFSKCLEHISEIRRQKGSAKRRWDLNVSLYSIFMVQALKEVGAVPLAIRVVAD